MGVDHRPKEGDPMTPAKDKTLEEIRDLAMEVPDDLAADTVYLIDCKLNGKKGNGPGSDPK